MITDSLNGYKGAYPDKVRALMRKTRKTLTSGLPDIDLGEAEDPVARYDYGPYCLKKRIDGTISGITEAQKRELSDLREAVYCLGNATGGDVPTEEAIQYPYETPGKIISFGGHESWLKEMRGKLPRVMFIPPDSLPNIDLIRNADAVWLQVNCLSHAHFYRIINAVRQNGIPL